jgi:cell division protein FtsW
VAVDHQCSAFSALRAVWSAPIRLPARGGRIDKFMTGEGDTFQVDTAREAIIRGDWFGQGPGEGIVKRIIPDSHTDFIFSVAAEEFGIIFCIALVF